MPPTNTPEDRAMSRGLARSFADPQHREFAEAYFDKETHAGSTSPVDRARHERHVQAVEAMQARLTQHAAAEQYRAQDWQPVDTRPQLEAEIRQLRNDPSYANGRHKGHADTMARLGYLYRALHPDSK